MFRSFTSKRRDTFRIATGSSEVAENVIVKLVSGQDFGIGNASPSNVTHETLQSVESFLSKVSKKISGRDETDPASMHQWLETIGEGNTAAKAAVDIAMYDLLSKRDKRPLYKYLGGSRNRILTDMTIGICSKDEAVRRAMNHRNKGFKALKIKVGLDLKGDIQRVAAIREAVGSKIELRVDANQGYTVEDAVKFAKAMKPLDVVVIEQPVKAEDIDGLKAVRMSSPVPIMADECVKSSLDARNVLRKDAVDMINIKLMKSAGLLDAVMINRLAECTGIPTMVGCMGEIQVSIAAGLHFALSSDNVKYADLDSHLNIVDDPSKGLELEDGYLVASKRYGLGVTTPLDDK